MVDNCKYTEDVASNLAALAIIRTGGKQYPVRSGDVIAIERSDFLRTAAKFDNGRELFWFEQVLMIKTDVNIIVDPAKLVGARVCAELLNEFRGEKITVFKKRRRHNYRRKSGHRQNLFRVRIIDILAPLHITASEIGDARPLIPVTGRNTAHDDFRAAIDSLRNEFDPTEARTWLNRIKKTDWSNAPQWTRRDMARRIEWYLNDSDSATGVQAAAALATVVEGGTLGEAPDWQMVGSAVSQYLEQRHRPMIEVSLDPSHPDKSDDGTRYRARIRVRQRLELPDGNRITVPTAGTEAHRLILHVKGSGIVPGTFKRYEAKELAADVTTDCIVSFVNRNNEDQLASIEIISHGKRLDQRFLNLATLTVSRLDPTILPQETDQDVA